MNSQELYEYLIKLKNDIESHYEMLYSNDSKYKAKKMKIKAKLRDLIVELRSYEGTARSWNIKVKGLDAFDRL